MSVRQTVDTLGGPDPAGVLADKEGKTGVFGKCVPTMR